MSTTTTTYAPGTIVIDHDGDALRVIEDRDPTLYVEYRDDRIIVLKQTIDPSASIRFRIEHDAAYQSQGAPWFVTSETPDPSGDHVWGHFPTHADAIAYVDTVSTR